MDVDLPFLTGVGCGMVLGISILTLPRMFRSARTTVSAVHKFMSKKEHKIVLVVRTDLNMTKGKIAAQCGHAAVGCFEKAQIEDPEGLRTWQSTGQAKIALKVDSLEDMKQICENAKKMGIITTMVQDAGRTEVARSTITVLGVGPAPKDVIDKVTGHLKLL